MDYFFGTASQSAGAATLDAVQQIVTSGAAGPLARPRIDLELAPSYCPAAA